MEGRLHVVLQLFLNNLDLGCKLCRLHVPLKCLPDMNLLIKDAISDSSAKS